MKCPHCQKTVKSKVLESRPYAGQVWRRRHCLGCFSVYVSAEHSTADMRMPSGTQSRCRITDRTPKPGQTADRITSTGLHLQNIWP